MMAIIIYKEMKQSLHQMSQGAYFCFPSIKPYSVNGHKWPMLLPGQAG